MAQEAMHLAITRRSWASIRHKHIACTVELLSKSSRELVAQPGQTRPSPSKQALRIQRGQSSARCGDMQRRCTGERLFSPQDLKAVIVRTYVLAAMAFEHFGRIANSDTACGWDIRRSTASVGALVGADWNLWQ